MVDVLAFGGSQLGGAIAGCQNIHVHCIPEAYALSICPLTSLAQIAEASSGFL